mmetsp:Transcript_29654/g.43162  ORF Transcript_29654/g.43162 Transcript_29654/m.43162 type:complete len:82 (+) Transcript_29654:148-393(+)
MAAKKQDTGRDIKSLALNFATTLFFFLPIVLYYLREETKNYAYATGASFLIAFLMPPVGWKRPHPYTDMPGNEPYPRPKQT